jgi:hypothetical protein
MRRSSFSRGACLYILLIAFALRFYEECQRVAGLPPRDAAAWALDSVFGVYLRLLWVSPTEPRWSTCRSFNSFTRSSRRCPSIPNRSPLSLEKRVRAEAGACVR